jgi:hypothetical protein
MTPCFKLRLFKRSDSLSDAASLGCTMVLLAALVRCNVLQLRQGVVVDGKRRPLPSLYSSGVRYKAEPKGRESWQDAPTTLQVGHGDCEDLAAWRAAELRLQGENAQACLHRRIGPDGASLMHAVVRRADGSIEDPSAKLGMYGDRGR